MRTPTSQCIPACSATAALSPHEALSPTRSMPTPDGWRGTFLVEGPSSTAGASRLGPVQHRATSSASSRTCRRHRRRRRRFRRRRRPRLQARRRRLCRPCLRHRRHRVSSRSQTAAGTGRRSRAPAFGSSAAMSLPCAASRRATTRQTRFAETNTASLPRSSPPRRTLGWPI